MVPLWPLNFWRRKSDAAQSDAAQSDAKTTVATLGEDAAPEENALAPKNASDLGVVRAADGNSVPTNGSIGAASGVRSMPRPALRWLGVAGRIALRPFDFVADADAVCAFQQETYALNFPDFQYSADFAAAFRHDLRRAALDSNHALFVLDEGEILGFLWLVVCENNWTRERYGYVNNVYVAPARRGSGLSRDLMAQADVFFRNRRVRRVRLTVTAANAAAVQLYQGCGYQVARWEMEKEL